jgi:hypothetical protein
MLKRVQRRRELPTRVTQQLQVNAHKGLEYVFRRPGPLQAPWQLKLAVRLPGLTHITARVIGIGIRPEHIRPTDARVGRPSLKRIAIYTGVALAVVVSVARFWRRGGDSNPR